MTNPQPILIVPYDPAWPDRYDQERKSILTLLGGNLAAIEHIGSTAVPGLAAKPIIDILAAVGQQRFFPFAIRQLARLGYTYVSEYEAVFPERRFFFRGPLNEHSTHLHLVERRSDFWERHVRFRDRLRAQPATAAAYAALKRKLAEKHGLDREGYTEAKSEFIRGVLAQNAE